MIAPPLRRQPLAEGLHLTLELIRNRALAVRRDWESRSLYGFAVAMGVCVFFFILVGTFAGVRVLVNASAYQLLASIPAWAFLVYLFTDVLIAFGQALGDLYLSRDMPILMSLPLRIPSIVFAKFVLGVVQNEVYVTVFLVPFAIGYLLGTGAAWSSYIIALIAVFIFPATLYAALIVITILALRVIPPKIAKEGLWLIGASVPTVFWFLSFYRVAHISGSISTMRLPAPPIWLPSTWVGNAIAMLGQGSLYDALIWMGVLAVVTFVACPAAMAFVSATFAKGWSAAIGAPARRGDVNRGSKTPSTPAMALAIKDLKTFARSPQLWFNHIAALGFVGYLIVGHSVQTPLIPLTTQLAMIQVGFVAVLGALNPGMTALSLEHMAIWVLRSAPIRASEILAAKFGVAFVQTGVIAALGAGALAYGYGFSFKTAAVLIVFGLATSASSVCVGIAFDAAFPSFTWENPNQINRGLRMVVPFLINVGVLVGCGIVLFVLRAAAQGEPRAAIAAGLTTTVLLQLMIALGALRRAQGDLAALEV